ncbi:MAG: TlpA family protein disulfide reductase [Acidobacteria bacterium]|nr:TlpA family protein disulfide reductase [Acidobacteriota bacterium]MBK8147654.1 TlpA family protein disulfide reductase [Acidobacteriota bacterium]MBK8809553.1 TlpA family protein disulfide reductase [Acidobacteriota bacterium]
MILLLAIGFLSSLACRPAAKPVAIGNKPVSINEQPTTNQPQLPPSKPIEEMTWTKFDGKTGEIGAEQKMKSLNGKVVILDFWATYCKPCIEMIPHLKKLRQKHPDSLEVVGLHVGGGEDFPNVPAFVERLKIDYPLGTPESELSRFVFGDRTEIPQTAIFDRQGKLVKKMIGFDPTIEKEIDEAVEKAVNQK